MGMVLGATGHPEPPPSVVARLQQIDPKLSLAYQAWPMAGETKYWWRVRRAWDSGDPRWQMVHAGELQPEDAYDMVAQLPTDCTADDAPAYYLQHFCGNPRQAQEASRRVAEWNARQQQAVVQQGGDYAEALLKDQATTLTGTKRVYQTEHRTQQRAF